jgi:hypothetical protein
MIHSNGIDEKFKPMRKTKCMFDLSANEKEPLSLTSWKRKKEARSFIQ